MLLLWTLLTDVVVTRRGLFSAIFELKPQKYAKKGAKRQIALAFLGFPLTQ